MSIGKLYSRGCGWDNDEDGNEVKYFCSELIEIFSRDECDIDGKTGSYIYKYLEKNNLEKKYENAYKLSKIYTSWYFYYGEEKKITNQTL